MKTPRSRKGTALIVALVFAVVLALIAESLARVAFSRIKLYEDTRDRQRAQLAANSALNELLACVYGKAFSLFQGTSCPSDVAPPSHYWKPWSCSANLCQTNTTYAIGTSHVQVVGYWNNIASTGCPCLKVQATVQ